MIYSTRPPRNSTARLAWDLYVQTFKKIPESVSYSPNYDHQSKGWICEHVCQDVNIKQMNYGGSRNYVFYESAELIARKDEINAVKYVEPPIVEHADEKQPSEAEIELFNKLNEQLTGRIRELYLQGVKLFNARDLALSEQGCANVCEYLLKNGCRVVASHSPRDPTTHRFR